jgi:hypothetical protein
LYLRLAADGEAQLTDARTESFLANLLAFEGEIRDAIRKPLGCRSDVAVFLTGVSRNEAGNAGTISPRCSFGVSEYRLGSLARRWSRRRAVSALSYRPPE